jgi:hypothetical protein
MESTLKRSSPTLDKVHSNSGGNIEHSFDDDKGTLSPYDGSKKGRGLPASDDLESSFPESIQSASFEESSKVSFEDSEREAPTNKSANLFGNKPIAKVEVSAASRQSSDDESAKVPPSLLSLDLSSHAPGTRSSDGEPKFSSSHTINEGMEQPGERSPSGHEQLLRVPREL